MRPKATEDEFRAGGIVSGKEERAVDVPDETSTVSTTSVKDKKGEVLSVLIESKMFSVKEKSCFFP